MAASIECAVCKRTITSVRIECASCAHVNLCIDCFAAGSGAPELGHVFSHAYRIHENLASFSLFDKDWTAEEELTMLQGIDMYGLGNWRDIATLVATKSESAVHKHYLAVYLESPTAPMPSPLSPSASPAASPSSGSEAVSTAAAATSAPAAAPARDKPSAAGGGGRSGTGTGVGGVGTPGYSHSHIPKTEVSGYLPLRGDFDVEHDNDAEAILADMDFAEGEHATETELKLKILEIYNAKLDERERRKAFVLERGLLDYKRLLMAERRRPREERDVYDAFRPFARFLTPAEHEDLVRGVILENRLRKRVAQLQEYKRAGIRSLAEAQEYEAAKRKREQAALQRKHSSSSSYLYEGGGSGSGAAAGAAAGERGGAASRRARYNSRGGTPSSSSSSSSALGRSASGAAVGTTPSGSGSAGVDSAAAAAGGGAVLDDEEAGEDAAAGRKRKRGGGRATPAAAAVPMATTSVVGAASSSSSAAARGVGRTSSSSLAASSSSVPSSSATAAAPSLNRAASPSTLSSSAAAAVPPSFSLSGMPGAERLSPEERGLCEYLRLMPWQYQQIKATIVNLSLARGLVRRGDAASALVHVDVAKINGVYDFAVSAGWVRRPEG